MGEVEGGPGKSTSAKLIGCQVTPMGVNLSKHYKVNTDWVILKELKVCVAEFNLVPLHLLSNLRDKMYTMRPREYVYKKSEDGSFATHWSRLTDVDSGSAVKTYRQLLIEKAHLQVELWESDVFDPENPDA